MSKINILGLADQPWQTEILASFFHYIKSENANIEPKLAVADYFSILHAPEFLSSLKKSVDFDLHDLGSLYKSWQAEFLPSETDSQFIIESWFDRYKPTRTIDQISASNQLIFGWERTKYYLPLKTEWKNRIISDTIVYFEQLLESMTPDLVISIERVNLAFNVVYEMCKSKGIPFLLVTQSRIQNRWTYRLDFGLGSNRPLFYHPYVDAITREQMGAQAEVFLREFEVGKSPLYISNASRLSSLVNGSFIKRIYYAFFGDLQNGVINWKRLIKKIVLRAVLRRRHYAFKVKRLEQNLVKLTLWEIKQALTFSLRLVGFHFWGKTKFEPNSKYLLWCLHARPEDSTSVLGLGLDEVELLLETASKITDGTVLVVKEHPLMFGIRNLGFYKQLRINPKVVLVDPFINTQSLMRNENCLGTIGLSGTFLLEAVLISKGAFAFGVPEFSHCLDSSFLSLENYLQGQRIEKRHIVKNYLSHIFLESHWNDPAYLSEWSLDDKKSIFPRWLRISQDIISKTKRQE